MLNERTVPTTSWYRPVKCMPRYVSAVTSSWRRLSCLKVEAGQKAQRISVAWKKRYLVLVFRTVLVFTLWRCVEHCEYWTCAWLLSLIFVVLILLTNALQKHYLPCLQSEQCISINGETLSLFTVIPADTKMLQTYLINCINTGSFFSYGTCVYTVVYVYYVFFWLQS